MKRLMQHVKKYIIRGLIASIPLALTFFAVQLLYNMIDQRAVRILDQVKGIPDGPLRKPFERSCPAALSGLKN